MKGRKATPTALKNLSGTNQPSRENPNEPQVQVISKLPPAPKWFSKTAKKVYRMKGQELIGSKLISVLDLDMFVSYCIEYADYLESTEELVNIEKEINEAFRSATPYPGIDPSELEMMENLFKLRMEALQVKQGMMKAKKKLSWERAKSLAVEFGFTPSSRSRVTIIVEPKKSNPLQSFLNG